jgi:hypothetical protein
MAAAIVQAAPGAPVRDPSLPAERPLARLFRQIETGAAFRQQGIWIRAPIASVGKPLIRVVEAD